MQNLNNLTKFFTLLIGMIVIVLVWVTSVNAQAQLTERSKLAINGIGPIRVGMTVDEASRSARIKLIIPSRSGSFDDDLCSYVHPQGVPKGISFMVAKGRIARVDIDNERITTLKGAKIGNIQEQIIKLYPGQIKITPHHYVGAPPQNGKYLTFVPKDAADKNYRIVFETSSNRVTRFRSGKLPEVEYIEGCS
ncbi:hypothetical protein [Microcoleus sp. AT3-D2]|uniref:hypothetical protein n=1 Tax=Microcoleus sp. AT3-D2 TaxID=2818612 RepID=UPI002FD55D84